MGSTGLYCLNYEILPWNEDTKYYSSLCGPLIVKLWFIVNINLIKVYNKSVLVDSHYILYKIILFQYYQNGNITDLSYISLLFSLKIENT